MMNDYEAILDKWKMYLLKEEMRNLLKENEQLGEDILKDKLKFLAKKWGIPLAAVLSIATATQSAEARPMPSMGQIVPMRTTAMTSEPTAQKPQPRLPADIKAKIDYKKEIKTLMRRDGPFQGQFLTDGTETTTPKGRRIFTPSAGMLKKYKNLPKQVDITDVRGNIDGVRYLIMQAALGR